MPVRRSVPFKQGVQSAQPVRQYDRHGASPTLKGALDAEAVGSRGMRKAGPRHRAHPMRSDITITVIVRGARAALAQCRTPDAAANEQVVIPGLAEPHDRDRTVVASAWTASSPRPGAATAPGDQTYPGLFQIGRSVVSGKRHRIQSALPQALTRQADAVIDASSTGPGPSGSRGVGCDVGSPHGRRNAAPFSVFRGPGC